MRIFKGPDFPEHLLNGLEPLLNDKLNAQESILVRLVHAYDYIDRVNTEFVSQFATCKKGCAACCHIDVHLTRFEASFIEFCTGVPAHPYPPFTTGHRSPCPFLSEKKTCLIYDYRPLVCRSYHVLSEPSLCGIKGAEVLQYGTEAVEMSNPVFRFILKWIRHQNSVEFQGETKDIRDYFQTR